MLAYLPVQSTMGRWWSGVEETPPQESTLTDGEQEAGRGAILSCLPPNVPATPG